MKTQVFSVACLAALTMPGVEAGVTSFTKKLIPIYEFVDSQILKVIEPMVSTLFFSPVSKLWCEKVNAKIFDFLELDSTLTDSEIADYCEKGILMYREIYFTAGPDPNTEYDLEWDGSIQ